VNIDFFHVNWLAVLVAGLVSFFIGGAWYTAIFGEYWKKHSRYTEDQMKAAQTARPMPVFMGMMVLSYLAIAYFVALFVQASGANGVADGIKLGLLLWLVTSAVAFTQHISSIKGWGAYHVDCGYQFVYFLLMGVMLSVWK
jgi:hypothetical protein